MRATTTPRRGSFRGHRGVSLTPGTRGASSLVRECASGFHDHRQDHRLALGHIHEVALQDPSDVLLQGRWVGDVGRGRLGEDSDDALASLLQDVSPALFFYETP